MIWKLLNNKTNIQISVNQGLRHNLGYKQKIIQVIRRNQVILVFPTFRLIQQSLSGTRC